MKFIDFEYLELDDRTIKLKIANIKWGMAFQIGDELVMIERGDTDFKINGIGIQSKYFPELHDKTLFIQGNNTEKDAKPVEYTYKTEVEAWTVFNVLKSLATCIRSAEKNKIGDKFQGVNFLRMDEDVLYKSYYGMDWGKKSDEGIIGFYEGHTHNVWNNREVPLKTPHITPLIYDHEWINQIVEQEKIKKILEEKVDKFDVTLKKEEVKMKIVKEEILTVGEAIKKFHLENAFIVCNDRTYSKIKHYNQKGTIEFYREEAKVYTTTITIDETTGQETEIKYIIENGNDFIDELNKLKSYSREKHVTYALKPKFAIGETVTYSPDGRITPEQSIFPKTIQEMIIKEDAEKNKKNVVIIKVGYTFDDIVDIEYIIILDGCFKAVNEKYLNSLAV